MIDTDFIPTSRFAIAFSGGGDSTALVHMCRNKNPLVLIVDHALRDGSKPEADQARNFATSLGLETQVLTWDHDNPKTGIQEKARKARYGLMGKVCRDAGIKYLLTAHSEDDQAETLLMRYDRGTDWRGAAGMAKAVYAPVWPELAEVTLVRPLLGVSRQDLRDYNRTHELNWIEDPSNENRDFTRIRARDYLAVHPEVKTDLLHCAKSLRDGLETEARQFRHFVNRYTKIDENGIIEIGNIPPSRLLGILLRVASGTGGSFPRDALLRLARDMKQQNFKPGTLGGALVVKSSEGLRIGREPVAAKGRANKAPIAPLKLDPGQSAIWDGRFKIAAGSHGTKIITRHNLHQMMYERGKAPFLDYFEKSLPKNLGETAGVKFKPLMASRLQKMLMRADELMTQN